MRIVNCQQRQGSRSCGRIARVYSQNRKRNLCDKCAALSDGTSGGYNSGAPDVLTPINAERLAALPRKEQTVNSGEIERKLDEAREAAASHARKCNADTCDECAYHIGMIAQLTAKAAA